MAHSGLTAAEMKPPEHPLEVLPAMLNMVLIQTGKLLRDPDSHHPRAIGLTRTKINEFVPLANDRFHDALDEIEIKILDAKAVMERDLRTMRRKREERLGVKAASKTPSPTQQEVSNLESLDLATLNTEGLANDNLPEGHNSDNDLVMLDIEPSVGEKAAFGENNVVTAQGMPPDTANSAGLAISMVGQSVGKDARAPEDGASENKAADAEASTIQNQADQEDQTMDYDFDAIFNDGEFGGSDNNLNFDGLDLSMNDTGPQSTMVDNGFDDFGLSSSDLANGTSTNEDINSLLPGLDAYVNASSGQAGSNNNSSSATAKASAGPDSATNPSMLDDTQPDTSLDDLFSAEFNLDEDWLKM